MSSKWKILFLCTGNSCRSQMAEGLCRQYRGDVFECFSAGLETHGLNPRAVQVMAEIGIDISGHSSKTTAAFDGMEFDFVVTVCGHANETCPYFPAATKLVHRGFKDPPAMAANLSSEDDIMAVYREVRDQIKNYVMELPGILAV